MIGVPSVSEKNQATHEKHVKFVKRSYFLVILHVLLLLTVFLGEAMSKNDTYIGKIEEVSDAQWTSLAEKRIFFGHQSVGQNIIDGIENVIKNNANIHLEISNEINDLDLSSGIFFHTFIGENEKPKTKIEHFEKIINKYKGKISDFAFFKFCYVDFYSTTDINSLFYLYKNKIKSLKLLYPDTQFIHLTVPLTVVQKGFKAKLKGIIGRPIGGYQENIVRNGFNNLIIDEYAGKDAIFDLAKFESMHKDGTSEKFSFEGKEYLALAPEYALEKVLGRHLNEQGSRFVAEQLLIFLAKL